jgi:hypothetical protein
MRSYRANRAFTFASIKFISSADSSQHVPLATGNQMFVSVFRSLKRTGNASP